MGRKAAQNESLSKFYSEGSEYGPRIQNHHNQIWDGVAVIRKLLTKIFANFWVINTKIFRFFSEF